MGGGVCVSRLARTPNSFMALLGRILPMRVGEKDGGPGQGAAPAEPMGPGHSRYEMVLALNPHLVVPLSDYMVWFGASSSPDRWTRWSRS
jgi:hypothetical protein